MMVVLQLMPLMSETRLAIGNGVFDKLSDISFSVLIMAEIQMEIFMII